MVFSCLSELCAGGLEAEPERGNIVGLEIGKEYWVVVEEDEVAESAQPRTTYKAQGGGPKGIKIVTGDAMGGALGEDSASCSCVEGNPCQSSYNCKNWAKRFEIAKANGWKGY